MIKPEVVGRVSLCSLLNDQTTLSTRCLCAACCPHLCSLAASTMETLESCPTQARYSPSAEKLTECTQPPAYTERIVYRRARARKPQTQIHAYVPPRPNTRRQWRNSQSAPSHLHIQRELRTDAHTRAHPNPNTCTHTCPTQAQYSPSAEKLTECTEPPPYTETTCTNNLILKHLHTLHIPSNTVFYLANSFDTSILFINYLE